MKVFRLIIILIKSTIELREHGVALWSVSLLRGSCRGATRGGQWLRANWSTLEKVEGADLEISRAI